MPNYNPILDSEIQAERPITESLITRLRDNPLSLLSTPTVITATGIYSVPLNVTKLRVACFSGGGGGGSGGGNADPGTFGSGGGGGGGGAVVREFFVDVTGQSSIAVTIGAAGSGGAAPGAGSNATGGAGSDGGDTVFDTGSLVGGPFTASGTGSGGSGGAGGNSGAAGGAGGDGPWGSTGGVGGAGQSSSNGLVGNDATNKEYAIYYTDGGTPGLAGVGAESGGGGGGGGGLGYKSTIEDFDAYVGGDGGDNLFGNGTAGTNASFLCGGGGGGGCPGNSSNTPGAGGNGGAGRILVWILE